MVPFGRTAAIFDADDSLLDGNAGTIFTWYLYSEKVMRPDARARVPRVLYEYARRRLTEKDMVEMGSKCQVGLRADEIKAHAHVCFERHLRKRITAGAVRQIRKHLLSGHFVILASGSPQYIVDEIGRHLRVHAAVGTRTRIVDGRATDEIIPPVVFEEGKREVVEKLRAVELVPRFQESVLIVVAVRDRPAGVDRHRPLQAQCRDRDRVRVEPGSQPHVGRDPPSV